MKRSSLCAMLFCIPFIATTDAIAQDRQPCAVAQPGSIVLYGDIPAPVVITKPELLAMPQATARETRRDGEIAVYSGPRLEDVLSRAGLPRGQHLRGNDLSRYVVVEAADGYRALFALAELDSAYRASTPLLAVQHNDADLDENIGPFQVIVPDEQRHGRWVRQVVCLRIDRDTAVSSGRTD